MNENELATKMAKLILELSPAIDTLNEEWYKEDNDDDFEKANEVVETLMKEAKALARTVLEIAQ
jgi:hypothetical protein